MNLINILIVIGIFSALLGFFGPRLERPIKSFIEQLVRYYILVKKREDGEKIDG
jgi:hypothetical protein